MDFKRTFSNYNVIVMVWNAGFQSRLQLWSSGRRSEAITLLADRAIIQDGVLGPGERTTYTTGLESGNNSCDLVCSPHGDRSA
jgi:hypothetical protein